MLKRINNDYPDDLIFSLQKTRFFDLTIQVLWSTLLLLNKKSNFFHMLFEVLLLVFLNCTVLLTFFGVGGSRACVRHVLPTSSDVGQCRLQSVSTLDRLKFGGENSFFHVWNLLILHISWTHCAWKHLRRFISVSVRLHASAPCRRTDKIRAV